MPTATITTKTATSTSKNVIPLKAGQGPTVVNATTTAATLRSLYNRAARAFLHKDVELTSSLLISAFSLIQPPSSYASDVLAAHRRKWDILRITLETTIYASPTDSKGLPAVLRNNLVSSPQTLINTLHERSLALFTPTSHPQKPNSAFLPSQVLVTLVLSSMKLECPDVGRGMVEDWLARRGQFDESEVDAEGYEKVLDMYCLHVLPLLEEWDYAKEFLQYEGELPKDKREQFMTSLQYLYIEKIESRRPPSPPKTPTLATTSPRSISPAPSASSSSSSLSTTSTHTAVPRTPRSNAISPMVGLTPSASSASVASDATITRRSSQPHSRNATDSPAMRSGTNRTASVSSSVSSSSVIRPPRAHPLEAPVAAARPPTTLALIKASLSPYFSTSKMTTFLLLFVLVPLMSIALKLRRRRQTLGVRTGTITAADAVRRRLAVGQGETAISRIWGEVVRAVADTIRMGGGGLV